MASKSPREGVTWLRGEVREGGDEGGKNPYVDVSLWRIGDEFSNFFGSFNSEFGEFEDELDHQVMKRKIALQEFLTFYNNKN